MRSLTNKQENNSSSLPSVRRKMSFLQRFQTVQHDEDKKKREG